MKSNNPQRANHTATLKFWKHTHVAGQPEQNQLAIQYEILLIIGFKSYPKMFSQSAETDQNKESNEEQTIIIKKFGEVISPI